MKKRGLLLKQTSFSPYAEKALPLASSWAGPGRGSTLQPGECCPQPEAHGSSTGNSGRYTRKHTNLNISAVAEDIHYLTKVKYPTTM